MRLLIDIGNTSIKWSIEHNSTRSDMQVIKYKRENILGTLKSEVFNREKPASFEEIAVSNVAGIDVENQLQELFKDAKKVVFAIASKKFDGLENAYNKPAQLGVDRWLALIAACQFDNDVVCVMDFGTAITIDVIVDQSKFIGGVILPGLGLMESCLFNNANQIYDSNRQESITLYSRNTSQAVKSGCMFAAAGVATKMINQLVLEYGEPVHCVLTGSDASFVSPYLPVPSIIIPDLVLQGLSKYCDTRQHITK